MIAFSIIAIATMAPKPKVATAWEIAKPLLEKDYLDGLVNDEMPRGEVHRFRDEYKKVPINNFGNNWLRMKRSIWGLDGNFTSSPVARQNTGCRCGICITMLMWGACVLSRHRNL